ncbi:E3 ubiquitin protein ligase DRIP2-like isoform X2 [Impatiens glandulifera]|uniref:E3 ubiquitin protein ligase DRIP2-like isoform X2 n=1 Tax=Impatiens glandulifera TaxID=253017 RepID=UPI001FB085A1|nr:E3 ubiquitin protein ligase DRIP2-like isoform X2 [Impatiens glandulifera]
MMSGQLVKVRKEALAACMKCPLCNMLLREATTISLCLHTFCRKCIYEKLSDEDVDSCPVCNVDLGCVPVDKLRPDHSLQDIRAKIFPYKRRQSKTPQVVLPSSVSPPVKRKERSLSSLVVTTPKVPMHIVFTGRTAKPALRKMNFRGPSSSIKESAPSEDFLDKLQNTSPGNPSPQEETLNKEVAKDVQTWERNVDLWKPLNCLVEAANRTKPSKLCHQDSPFSGKLELPDVPDYDNVRLSKTRIKEQPQKSKSQLDNKINNELNPVHGRPVKRKRLHDRNNASGGLLSSSSGQSMISIKGAKENRPNCPIWFSLVASRDQREIDALPQIPAGYLRVKDGNLPVSFIQKYLMKKLDLTSEAEVEITCQGNRVLPTLQLQNVLDLWLQTPSATSRKVSASVGSSAKEFVMVLSYSRKLQTT